MWSFLKQKSYHHLNKVVISQEALRANHQALQAFHANAQVCPVLKSNAYGHGLKEVAPVFDSMKCPFLVVDSLFEAYELYKLQVKTPILIMGYTHPTNFTLKRLPFEIALFDFELAATLNQYQPGCHVHIFVDTGMSREGILVDELPTFLTQLKKLNNINVVGLCSHFADADNPRSQQFTDLQVNTYKKALTILTEYGFSPMWKHISASAGSYKLHDKTFNMIRAGLAHYGITPLEENDRYKNEISLQPALEFSSTLAQIKGVPKGSFIGYNRTYTAKKDIVLGLLPAGYYEGVDRRLSNKGFVKIREKFFPIVGRISMNMTIIDITELDGPEVGESAIIYSSQESDKNSLKNAAILVRTTPYELPVHIAESVKRIVI